MMMKVAGNALISCITLALHISKARLLYGISTFHSPDYVAPYNELSEHYMHALRLQKLHMRFVSGSDTKTPRTITRTQVEMMNEQYRIQDLGQIFVHVLCVCVCTRAPYNQKRNATQCELLKYYIVSMASMEL